MSINILKGLNTSTGAGVHGESSSGYGVYGKSTSSYAGYLDGNTRVTGNLTVDGTLTAPGVGDITAVTAGTGLTGGGTSGAVTLTVATPLTLSGSSGSPIVSGTNSGGGQGLYGSNSGGIGVQGSSSTATGVYGASTSGSGVYGSSTSGYGVYGSSVNSYAGYFSGDIKLSGTGKGIEFYDGTKQTTAVAAPFSLSGSYAVPIMKGVNASSGAGVHGESNSGYGVYGKSTSSYAGYLDGNTRVTGNLTVDGTFSAPGVGDITAVNAGTGLSGGGTSGAVTLSAALPFSLSGANSNPIVKGVNTSTGTGVHGESSSGYGLYGKSTSSYAGYFDGDVKINGDLAVSGSGVGDITAVNAGNGLTGGGTSGAVTLTVASPLTLTGTTTADIIKGDNNSSGAGVHGLSETGKGVSGESTSGYAVYGKTTSGYAGYFSGGDVKIATSGKGVVFPDGTKQTTAVEGGGGGVPAGFFIMGDTPTPPAGYTYTGEVITSSKGQWKVKASMPTARYRLAAAVVNNRIYVIGGESSKGSYSNKNEEYDPATNTWATKANMPTARSFLGATAAENKIYAIGGYNGSYLNKNEEYDPATNTWATKANMPTARRGLGVAAGYLEGWTPRLIAFGGYNGNYLLATTELYQPGTDEWQTVSDMNTETAYMGVAVVGYQIYAIGGMSEKVERWNVSYWETRAEMPEKGTELAAAVIDNKIYAIGGSGGNFGDSLYAYSTNYEYDTASNTWSARADIPTARKGFVAAAVNNKIYAIGGMDNTYTPFNTNEEYSPPITFYVHQKD